MKMIIKGGKIFDAVNKEPYIADILVEDGKIAYDLEQITKDKVTNNTYETLTRLPGVREENEVLTLEMCKHFLSSKCVVCCCLQLIFENVPKARKPL